jgi:hypothetical protein
MIESEDTMRARFLMSPYNVSEARRVKQFHRSLWCVALITIVGIALFGTIIYWR